MLLRLSQAISQTTGEDVKRGNWWSWWEPDVWLLASWWSRDLLKRFENSTGLGAVWLTVSDITVVRLQPSDTGVMYYSTIQDITSIVRQAYMWSVYCHRGVQVMLWVWGLIGMMGCVCCESVLWRSWINPKWCVSLVACWRKSAQECERDCRNIRLGRPGRHNALKAFRRI